MATALVVTDSVWVRNDVHASLSVGFWDIHDLDDPLLAAPTITDIGPDVVIIDMQIGSMGGMATIRDIRGRVDSEAQPRLVLLLDRSADRFLAHRAGADASVLKPFSAPELRTAIGPMPHDEDGHTRSQPPVKRKAAPKPT